MLLRKCMAAIATASAENHQRASGLKDLHQVAIGVKAPGLRL